jgi:hypothetical protein
MALLLAGLDEAEWFVFEIVVFTLRVFGGLFFFGEQAKLLLDGHQCQVVGFALFGAAGLLAGFGSGLHASSIGLCEDKQKTLVLKIVDWGRAFEIIQTARGATPVSLVSDINKKSRCGATGDQKPASLVQSTTIGIAYTPRRGNGGGSGTGYLIF